MNTKGHADVAQMAGMPVLKRALAEAGRSDAPVEALEMGNWLTDVSQFIDPVALDFRDKRKVIEAAHSELTAAIDAITASLLYKKAKQWLPLLDVKGVRDQLDHASSYLLAGFDALFVPRGDPRRTDLFNTVREAIRLTAYFKFVHPAKATEPQRMSFNAFELIFDQLFTQYYPHEHLDRPALNPGSPSPIYASKRDRATRSPSRRVLFHPDLYAYLRDDIEVAAGQLADLDINWARWVFVAEEGVDADVVALNLARLGHALHAVEDFFAHSTFIERAALALGKSFMPKQYQQRDSYIFARRLKRYPAAETGDWQLLPNEEYVVTGYFDPKDTLFSVLHVAEEIVGDWPVLEYLFGGSDPVRVGAALEATAEALADRPRTALVEYQRVLRDTLDFLDDPVRMLGDQENVATAAFREKYGDDMGALSRPSLPFEAAQLVARNSNLFNDPRILHTFVNVVIGLNRSIAAGKVSVSTYKAMKALLLFMENPAVWLTDWIKGEARDYLLKSVLFYVRQLTYDYFGQSRLGCHSLLAKDTGSEWLYRYQKTCATAVHWYIVKTLTRWANLSRGERRSGSACIDWLEFLETFLRNPLSQEVGPFVPLEIPIATTHIVDGGARAKRTTLEELARLYAPSSDDPASFTWETIADANFATTRLSARDRRNVSEAILGETGNLKPEGRKTLTLPPSGRVIVPRQRATVRVSKESDASFWFEPIMERERLLSGLGFENRGWEVWSGYEDPETKQSVVGHVPHDPIRISLRDAQLMVRRAEEQRRTLEQLYAPSPDTAR